MNDAGHRKLFDAVSCRTISGTAVIVSFLSSSYPPRYLRVFFQPFLSQPFFAVESSVLSRCASEFSQVLQSDACRLQQLQCHTTASPLHPFRKFTWGEWETEFEGLSE